MGFNGSGTFNRVYDWETEAGLGNPISSTKMDIEMDGFASGLSNVICRDGQSVISNNIPFNSKRLTGLGDAVDLTDALNKQTGNALYQPLDADLTAIAGLTSAANKFAYYTGSATASLADLTAFGRSLIDDADAATARTTLGLGTIATQASSAVSITGGSITGITDLAIADGGTGASTAAGARTNLGATTIGDQLFTASNAGTARGFLGASTVGDQLFVASNSDVATAALGFQGKVVALGSFYENAAGTSTTVVVSENIASIGTGSAPAITFSSALSNTNYVVVPAGAVVQGGYALAVYASNLTTSGFTLNIIRNDGAGSWPNTASAPLMFTVIQGI